jgi:predicted CXXCH cytochrome family protein
MKVRRAIPPATLRRVLVPSAGALLTTLLCAASLQAQDPPHWASASINIDCTSQCHVPHQASGGAITANASNVALCQSCHSPAGLALDLSINSGDAAVPGTGGFHHAFDVCSQNAETGAQPPLDNEMLLRVMGADAPCPEGYVVCSTCHNQHSSDGTLGGTPRTSPAKQITSLGSTGSVTSQGTFNGAESFWYLVEIDGQGSQSTATFQWSKDNGMTWMQTGVGAGNGGPVALADGVEAVFTGGGGTAFLVGERWEFSGSWPFLRAALDQGGAGSVICRDCHRDWDVTAVDTWNGGSVKSHPVRVAYPAPGTEGYYDDGPREGDGTAQGTGDDGNPTNDLVLDGNSHVECLTCHAPHYADSNTLTIDRP